MTRTVKIGNTAIGGGNPIRIQSMANTKTDNVEATVKQILDLERAGCEIIRVAVPDMAAAKAIDKIKSQIHIPLVADIHFDHRLALEAIAAGVDKVRINPGNIGDISKVKAVVNAAANRGVPIRIGVNSGSLEREVYEKYGGVTPEALVESALGHVRILNQLDFDNIVISIKATDVKLTYDAYNLLKQSVDYPLHLGVTEAGTQFSGTVKSAIGIGSLLLNGIGDTIRVSLTESPIEEVRVAKKILEVLNLRDFGIRFISCPTCGRTNVDLFSVAKAVEEQLKDVPKKLTLAIMGCAVNGPGEAREADLGIAGGKGEFLIFKKGIVIKKVKESEVIEALLAEIETM
ncbi:MAG: (E)-4-hydroxy-3-methylbut-2-enyl-diphosphate synthase [Clostridiales bacterium]|jgi:(E)-4-hydroxy-3-methylbut-2-enyl-diphosphate synthase|nr:(E)-4-hydroxy-3-methylbut-2-enyl-diphosphate synthase [Clostridiales bacterium]MDN5298159.1 (E)-4-hydroxy-3-methylbut-2-enyl-diphosphate synthase [Clostridiales bacterium]